MQITPTWYRILKKAVISMTETEKKFDAIRRAYPETISNVIAKIGDVVKKYAERKFRPGDFSRIIHITDTDGTFIPDEAVVEDAAAVKPLYSATEIRTQRKSGIENRNQRKRECLNRLSSASRIWGVPYQIYYMSCNLDHALYGKLNSTDDEKEADAFAFAKKYRDDIPGFMKLISESDFSVAGNYPQSWQYIREGLHSLERHGSIRLSPLLLVCKNK